MQDTQGNNYSFQPHSMRFPIGGHGAHKGSRQGAEGSYVDSFS